MLKLTIVFVGILLMNFSVAEDFDPDDVPDSVESAEMYDETYDMKMESRQILLNPQKRRERRRKRIGSYHTTFAQYYDNKFCGISVINKNDFFFSMFRF